MRVLQPDDYVMMPWRNGGGTTRELAAERHPDGSLAWRISIATVDRSGPFSSFPSLVRIITLLDGHGMALRSGDALPVVIADALRPYRFSGDDPTDCTLLRGAVTDFNVIYDPRRAGAEVQPLVGSATVSAGGRTLFAYAVAAARLGVGGRALSLDKGWSAILGNENRQALQIELREGTVLLVLFADP